MFNLNASTSNFIPDQLKSVEEYEAKIKSFCSTLTFWPPARYKMIEINYAYYMAGMKKNGRNVYV